MRALMPLHKPKCVAMYHQQLAYCVTQVRVCLGRLGGLWVCVCVLVVVVACVSVVCGVVFGESCVCVFVCFGLLSVH